MWSLSLPLKISYKFNALSTLSKYLGTVAVTSAVWGETAKLAQISVSFFMISQMEDSFFPYILAISADDVFLSLWSRELSPFHLKEALFGFSLAYPNCSITTLALWGH